ncbi:MAG TPA: TIGR04222 domain-containing membrane protein [Candidatus Limnocylindrales bacterium]|nr:TIGR04222 domain-containing membrane protein [Candidatus Limnocylindrales bacterium]
MYPFDLSGPEFLVFYIVFGISVLVVLRFWQRAGERVESPAMNLSDPYLIAYLRGGKNEVLRVATVSLIDRGVLGVSGSIVSARSKNAAGALRIPVEQNLANYFQKTEEAASVFKASLLDEEPYKEQLIKADLLPGPQQESDRMLKLLAAVLILVGVAVFKIILALERGHSNIQFLIVLAIVFTIFAFKFGRPRLTRKGESTVANLRLLFNSLKLRGSSLVAGKDAGELLMLAAVFGVNTIPTTVFPHAKAMYPQAASSSSSCGSSSCGSSCGGGGCGGGCGGCGS